MRTLMQILRWTNNIATTILLVLVAYIVLAHFVDAFAMPKLTNKEASLTLAMVLMFAGAFIAFWKRMWGGIITILSYVVFALINGNWMLGIVFYSFLAIGLVNLVLAYYYKKH